ncbi:MAG: conjugative transfer signal peptidase TraF [Burkholderiaceae bacterium]|nr:conjugative transfer signal peptidase TraF [Burkholderiaceae bacterium]
MKPRLKSFPAAMTIGGAGIVAIGLACYAAGMRVNTSKSIALGIYWTSAEPVRKGAYVLLCPPQVGVIEEARRRGYLAYGFCPGNYGYLMKKVFAVAGDTVDIGDAGVSVNDLLLPFSMPLKHDTAGRPLPRYQASHFVIGNSELLLMSDASSTSFDGRYFGPVNRSQIKTVIVPVFTW